MSLPPGARDSHPQDSPRASDPITEMLRQARTIAVVGLSSKRFRPSHGVAEYLQSAGYRIIPVNPHEREVLGEKAYARLEDIAEPVDIVDIFRRSEQAAEAVESAIRIGAKGVWMQEGVIHHAAGEQAGYPEFLIRGLLMRGRCSVGVALLAASAAATAVDWTAEGKRWWAHVQYLADDKLEGRNTGSEGHRKAAAYVAGRFRAYGLQPAGTQGYLQPVKFEVREIDEAHSSVELAENGKHTPLELGEDVTIGLRTNPPATLEAAAVFVGYGLSVPEIKFDDLAGLDLKGKIAVYLSGGPDSIPGPLRAHAQSASERWKALGRAGAAGVAVIPNPQSMDIPWSRAKLARFQAAMELVDASLKDAPDQKLTLTINPERAERWFRGSGHTLAGILALADAGKELPRFALSGGVRARVAVKRSRVESQNVAALLPGTDAKLQSEFVVLTAHLDHVGVGQPINGDAIYNGAMDNASGVASLLEIARGLKASGVKLRRPVLFLAVTGEEKGLLGSKYFVAHPTVPAKNIVADINMDMFLPLFPLRYLQVQGLDESTLGDDIRAVARAAGVEVQADPEPNRNHFIRSDQYNFIRAGIPALAFKFGFLPGSKEDKMAHEWVTVRYHAPSDDANQPVDLEGAAQFNAILARLAERVANANMRPQWHADSFFRRFVAAK